MRDELLLYYERELTYLRQMAVQFAEKYPKVAGRLVLEPDKCEDPHVERLLEAFAFLAARVHMKIDDEFPEITEALLGIVYPHFVRPIPSMSIVEFEVDLDQGKLTGALTIPKDSPLHSRSVQGVPCIFRTCYDTVLWPVSVTACELKTLDRLQPPIRATDAATAIRLELKTAPDIELNKLGMDSLRFFLNGESSLVHTLYELLSCNLVRVVLRDPTPGSRVRPVTLPASCLRPVGFGEHEGMLPYAGRSFLPYRLLQELFAFPDKFMFLDLTGLKRAWDQGFTDRAEIVFLLSKFEGEARRERLHSEIDARTFRLSCVPVVNLFPQTAEPILLDQRRYEYPVEVDLRRPNALEIYSIEEVVSVDTHQNSTRDYLPFYSIRHGAQAQKHQTFWISHRRASNRLNDDGTDVYLSLVDLALRPVNPDEETLTVRTICTNRDLPARLPFGNEAGDFELESSAPIKRIMALKKPTPTIRPALGKSIQWRLISHLSLNYLSLVEEGREALQQILRLYNFQDSAYAAKMIAGISRLRSSRQFARLSTDHGIAFARGTRVEIEFDEEQFVGGGVYLFAAVLERFLGMYATLNSFSQLVARSAQRKEVIRVWPPRAGRKILI